MRRGYKAPFQDKNEQQSEDEEPLDPKFPSFGSRHNQPMDSRADRNKKFQPLISGDFLDDEDQFEQFSGGKNLSPRKNRALQGGYASQGPDKRPKTSNQRLKQNQGYVSQKYNNRRSNLDQSGDDDSMYSVRNSNNRRTNNPFARSDLNRRNYDEFGQVKKKIEEYIWEYFPRPQQKREFLKPFNPHEKRTFQDWELERIFELEEGEGEILRKGLSKKNDGNLSCQILADKLDEWELNVSVRLPKESTYKLKKGINQVEEICKAFIKKVRNQNFDISNHRTMYTEKFSEMRDIQDKERKFQSIITKKKRESTGEFFQMSQNNDFLLSDVLLDFIEYEVTRDKEREYDHLFDNNGRWEDDVLRYFCPSDDLDNFDFIHVIQFVQGLNEFVADTQNHSKSMMSSRSQFESTNMMETINKNFQNKTKKQEITPLIKALCESLKKNKKELQGIKSELLPTYKKEIVKNNAIATKDVAKQQKLRKLLDSLQIKSLTEEQITNIIKTYSVQTKEQYEKIALKNRVDEKGRLPVTIEATVNEEHEDQEPFSKTQNQKDNNNVIEESDEFEKDEIETDKLQHEIQSLNASIQDKDAAKQKQQKDQEVSIGTSLDRKEGDSQVLLDKGKTILEPQKKEEQVEEMKEGGEKEEEELWFDFQQFFDDLSLAWNDDQITAEEANKILLELFEKVKRWKIVTGDSLLVTFRRYSQKGKRTLTIEGFKKAFQTVLEPEKLSQRQIDAVFLSLEQNGEKGKINFDQFYDWFDQHANQNKVTFENKEYDYLKEGKLKLEDMLNQININLEEEKTGTLVKFLAMEKHIKDADKRNNQLTTLEKPFRELIQQFKEFMNYQKDKNLIQNGESYLRQVLAKSGMVNDRVNLIKFHDLLGYKREKIIEAEEEGDRPFRQMAIAMQLAGITVKDMKEEFRQMQSKRIPGNLFRNKIKNLMQDQRGKNKVESDFTSDTIGSILTICIDKKNQNEIDLQIFLEKIEFEMNKLFCLIRFYLSLEKERLENKFSDIKDLFKKYNLQNETEIEKTNLIQLLADLKIVEADDDINNETSHFRYISDEYCDETSNMVDYKYFEDDFIFFISKEDSIIKKIVLLFLKVMKDGSTSIVRTLEGIFSNQEGKRGNSKIQLHQRNWIHGYDFIKWFQDISEKNYMTFDAELVNLFMEYINIEQKKPNKIYLPTLLENFRKIKECENDKLLDKQFSIRLKVKVIQHVSKCVVKSETQQARDFFDKKETELTLLMNVLKGKPFLVQNLTYTNEADIEEMIYDQFSKGASRIYVDEENWCNEVENQCEVIRLKRKFFLELQKSLEGWGCSIEEAIKSVKMNVTDFMQHGFDFNDFQKLCDVYKFKAKKEYLLQILATFEYDNNGEILCSDFVDEFNSQLAIGTQIGGQFEAKRFYWNMNSRLRAMANAITEKKLTDFGSFFKGNDFKKNNTVERHHVVSIVQKLLPELFGDGDILEIVEFFDQRNTGYVDIKKLADDINSYIEVLDCKVKLITMIDEVVTENIVEQILDEVNVTFADNKHFLEQIEAPTIYVNQLLLDIFCGIYTIYQTGLEDLFESYSQFRPGFISLNEFIQALNRIAIEADNHDMENVFNYLLKQTELKLENNDYIRLEDIIVQLYKDQQKHLQDEVEFEVVLKIAQHLSEEKLPILEICEKYDKFHPHDPQQKGYVLVRDFELGVLQDIKASRVLTKNMTRILFNRYNPQSSKYLNYKLFIKELEECERLIKGHIFMTQDQIDNQKFEDSGPNCLTNSQQTKRKYIQPKNEPEYQIRSCKNTYFNPEIDKETYQYDSSQIYIHASLRSKVDNLVLQTRMMGCTIESYFQPFGTFSSNDGKRKFSLQQFTQAIQSLPNLSWNNNLGVINALFSAILLNSEQVQYMKYGNKLPFDYDLITVENIGDTFFFNATIDLQNFEADVLFEVHQILFKNGYLDKVIDLLNFVNFNRDCNCSIETLMNVLYDQLGLNNQISQSKVTILLQKYAVLNFKKLKRVSHASGELSHKQELKQNQIICYYPFFKDLGYAHRGIGTLDQWASSIAEDLIKSYQVLRCQQNQNAIQDTEVARALLHFFRNINGGNINLYKEDFIRALEQLELWDERIYIHEQLFEFFDFCNLPELLDPIQFIPNKNQKSVLMQNEVMDLENFIKALEFLGRKPLAILYQEIIDRFYIASKKLKLSITGPKIINLFAEYDPEQTGQVKQAIFIQKLHNFLQESYNSGSPGAEKIGLLDKDLDFLATKYLLKDLKAEETKIVVYFDFIEDYDKVEHEGICAGLNELSMADKLQNREIKLRNKTLQTKTQNDLSYQSQRIYDKMSKYIIKKQMEDIFSDYLVNEDIERCGHLKIEQIKRVLSQMNMPLSSKQVNQLTECLNTDIYKRFNYLQMIALLLGDSIAQQVFAQNNIYVTEDYAPDRQHNNRNDTSNSSF